MSVIVVIDYHKGNLLERPRAVSCARAGTMSRSATTRRSSAPPPVVVLPGVGSFYDAIEFMRESGQDEAVLEAIGRGVPFLGICLGLQLLCERGVERRAARGRRTR